MHIDKRKETFAMAALALLAVATPPLYAEWSHFAGDAARTGVALRGPRNFDAVRWCATLNPDEEFIGRASPVVGGGLVVVPARAFMNHILVHTLLIAFDAETGSREWTAALPPDVNDSWSTPALDLQNELAVFGVADAIYGVNLSDGGIAWSRPVTRDIVNASPALAAVTLAPGVERRRAWITDFAPTGGATLYAINLDPADLQNPFQPGEIVWSAPLQMATSGATPAVADGVVVVGGFALDGFGYSAELRAYDAATGALAWARPLGDDDGFFGGVSIANGAIFAATYDFFGTDSRSRLFKRTLADGAPLWSTPCARTAAIPICSDADQVYLAAGVVGFGSQPRLQAFVDQGSSAELDWDTSAAPALGHIGSWTLQPVRVGTRLYVGRPDPADFFGPFSEAVILDLTRRPHEPGFIIDTFAGAGGSPALGDDGTLYTVGTAGLFAFAADARGDVNCDGSLTVSDIAPFVLALTAPAQYAAQFPNCDLTTADVNGDGRVTVTDIAPFVALLGGGG